MVGVSTSSGLGEADLCVQCGQQKELGSSTVVDIYPSLFPASPSSSDFLNVTFDLAEKNRGRASMVYLLMCTT